MTNSTSTDTLAINGGKPYRSTPFTKWPIHDDEEVRAVTDVAKAGKWWRCAYSASELEKKNPDQIEGRSRVEVFEERFAAAHRARFGIAVTNGSAALDIALRAVGIKPGDEVITTPYTFISTSMCIMNNFGVPVYTDIDPNNYNMNADQIGGLITERTKAIVPVHFSGNLCDMEKINAVAAKHRLAVVEDAAHAHGVEYKGQKFAGTFGDLGCFSFQESKNLSTGEGGMLLTDSEELYERAFSMHHLGRLPGELWYKHFHQAWNCRMNEFTASIGIVQLSRMFDQNARRMQNHSYLMQKLAQVKGIRPCQDLPGITKHSHHLQMLRYQAEEVGGVSRNDFVKALIAEGIPALTGYTFPSYANPMMNSDETRARYKAAGIELPDYKSYADRCPATERACNNEAIWLEHRLLLGSQQDMDDIAGGFSKVIRAFRGGQ